VILIGALLLALFVLPAPWGIVVVAAAVVVEIAETAFWIWLSRRGGPKVGAETFVGEEAEVVSPCRPEGHVRFQGELWQARCDAGADAGQTVRIRALEGLTLVVELV
jgi:membrane-bound serine protease (ClpP class)